MHKRIAFFQGIAVGLLILSLLNVSNAAPAECASITKCEDYTKDQCTTNPCKDQIKTDCELSGELCKTSAGSSGGGVDDDTRFIDEIKDGLYKVVMILYCLVLYIASAVAALAIILTGILYMSSDDERARVESRRRLTYAIIGLLIVAMACPLINVFFTDGKIGIPDANGNKVPCPTCPLVPSLSIGPVDNPPVTPGGSGTGSGKLGTGEKCTSTSVCTPDLFCSDNSKSGVTDGTCVKRYDAGESCNVNMEISDKNYVCVTGYACNSGTCVKDIAAGCANSGACPSGTYCNVNPKPTGFCSSKVALDEDCSVDQVKGSEKNKEDLMCLNGWCINGKCKGEGSCEGTKDCENRDANKYCSDESGDNLCINKIQEGKACAIQHVVSGDANDMCLSKKCGKDPNALPGVTSTVCLKP